MIGGFKQYNSLTDFINRTTVCKTEDGYYVVVVSELEGQPVTLIGFKTELNKGDFEVKEEGYNYYLRLLEELEKQ